MLDSLVFIGAQAVNFRSSTDRHEIFTHNSRWGWAHDLHFEILIFDYQKNLAGKKPKFRDLFAVQREYLHVQYVGSDVEQNLVGIDAVASTVTILALRNTHDSA